MLRKTKIYKIYSIIIKCSIIALAFGFVYYRLFAKGELYAPLNSLEAIFERPDFLILSCTVILLMILNWLLEILKWRFLIKKIEKLKFIKAMIGVLSGVTVSIVTPNRIGEYAGRVFVLEKADRWEAVLITILGSIGQLFTTIIAGIIGFIFYAAEYIPLFDDSVYFSGLLFVALALISILLLFFFRISFLTFIIDKLPGKLNKIKRYAGMFAAYSPKELLIVLLFCFARYLVFATEFFLMLLLFDVNMPYHEALMMISLIYFVMSIIPTIAITELGVRGSIALYFIGMYFEKYFPTNGGNDLFILAASTATWILNIAVPALIGTLFVFRLKFFRTK